MLNFFAGAFAIAGLAAAAGPVVIHLLNRRRYRVVEWAALDFLREALQRNRKVLQLRDLILLLLRILAVLFVGLALARPYFTNTSNALLFRYVWLAVCVLAALALAVWAVLSTNLRTRIAAIAGGVLAALFAVWAAGSVFEARALAAEGGLSSRQPVHAVLVLDNSASMGYESLDGGSLLARAQQKAVEFVDELPPESRVSVLPLCGSPNAFSFDAYRSREDAKDAIERIEVVDRGAGAARVTHAIDLAAQACERAPDLPAKRVVLLGDQQRLNWPAESLEAALERIPELQVVQVAAPAAANVWVSDFRVLDGIADTGNPTVFLGTVRCEGESAVDDVQVSLTVDELPVATRAISLEPGQERLVQFRYQVDAAAEPGQPTYVTASLEVETPSFRSDGLLADNTRYLTVPVVAGLPVVFVDQYGAAREDPDKGLVGETLPLRRLLVPLAGDEESGDYLVRIRHLTIDQLDQDQLADARLVVIAGVRDPGEKVPLLREYVRQGGQLVVLAGGDFDPVAWNERGWRDGRGILPAPLEPELVGGTFEEAAAGRDVDEFRLDFDTMSHPCFQLEAESREKLRDLYAEPVFVKAAATNVDEGVREALFARERERIEEERKFLEEFDRRRAEWAKMERKGTFGEAEEAARQEDERKRSRIEPNWLLWKPEQVVDEWRTLPPEELARRSLPRVLASYTSNRLPFLVTRRIGDGRVQFFSSGVLLSWNTLSLRNAMGLFLRTFGLLLSDTLPQRVFDTGEPVVLPAQPGERMRYRLQRPGSEEQEMLTVEAMGPQAYGFAVRNTFEAGHYFVTEEELDLEASTVSASKRRQIPLAINGPPEESELATLDEAGLRERLGEGGNYRWVGAGESISLEGAQIRGRDTWKLLVALALACLLVEMLVLSLPTLSQSAAPTGGPAT